MEMASLNFEMRTRIERYKFLTFEFNDTVEAIPFCPGAMFKTFEFLNMEYKNSSPLQLGYRTIKMGDLFHFDFPLLFAFL